VAPLYSNEILPSPVRVYVAGLLLAASGCRPICLFAAESGLFPEIASTKLFGPGRSGNKFVVTRVSFERRI
jgi:hypothetical protein